MSQQLLDAIQSKYGLAVNEGDLKLCVRDINAGRARRLVKVSSRISNYAVKLKHKTVCVGFDVRQDVITQVLDPAPIS